MIVCYEKSMLMMMMSDDFDAFAGHVEHGSSPHLVTSNPRTVVSANPSLVTTQHRHQATATAHTRQRSTRRQTDTVTFTAGQTIWLRHWRWTYVDAGIMSDEVRACLIDHPTYWANGAGSPSDSMSLLSSFLLLPYFDIFPFWFFCGTFSRKI